MQKSGKHAYSKVWLQQHSALYVISHAGAQAGEKENYHTSNRTKKVGIGLNLWLLCSTVTCMMQTGGKN